MYTHFYQVDHRPKSYRHRDIPMMATDMPGEISDSRAIMYALAEPFERDEVKFKPQSVKGNRALALAYVDVRVIQDRLDDVLGVDGWQDEYSVLTDMSVVCKLRLKIGKRWITRMDVGSQSEQPDGGDRMKAAFSDALKRAAVKFGMGRYLYRLSAQWVDYDPVKKVFPTPPKLPPFALPSVRPRSIAVASTPTPVPAIAAPAPAIPPIAAIAVAPIAAAKPSGDSGARATAAVAESAKKGNLPTNGKELHARLREFDTRLAQAARCHLGELLSFVTKAGLAQGFGGDMENWTGTAIAMAVEKARAFDLAHPLKG